MKYLTFLMVLMSVAITALFGYQAYISDVEQKAYYENVELCVESGYKVVIDGEEYSALPDNYKSYSVAVIDEDRVVVLTPKAHQQNTVTPMPIIIPPRVIT